MALASACGKKEEPVGQLPQESMICVPGIEDTDVEDPFGVIGLAIAVIYARLDTEKYEEAVEAWEESEDTASSEYSQYFETSNSEDTSFTLGATSIWEISAGDETNVFPYFTNVLEDISTKIKNTDDHPISVAKISGKQILPGPADYDSIDEIVVTYSFEYYLVGGEPNPNGSQNIAAELNIQIEAGTWYNKEMTIQKYGQLFTIEQYNKELNSWGSSVPYMNLNECEGKCPELTFCSTMINGYDWPNPNQGSNNGNSIEQVPGVTNGADTGGTDTGGYEGGPIFTDEDTAAPSNVESGGSGNQ
jgi:hypothetical protein